MILTPGQEAGLRMAEKLKEYNGKEPRIAVLAGYAGTGKTTLVAQLRDAWGGYPIVVAPTGKAALRVKEATGITARTVHSWMYETNEDEQTGVLSFQRKRPEDIDTGEVPVLAIDEASMVGPELWDDIFETAVIMKMNILIIGDPFQLPPVQKERDSFGNEKEFNLLSPDFEAHERVLLRDVVRQALDNPIIRASMMVRQGDAATAVLQLPRIRAPEFIDYAAGIMRQGSAVVIVHKNDTRNKLNVAVRNRLGMPVDRLLPGEPLLVLQNNYTLNRFNGETAAFQGWVEEPGNEHLVQDWIRKVDHKTRYGIAQLETSELDPWGQAVVALEQVFGRMGHMHERPIEKRARILFGGGIMPSPEELAGMSPDERRQALGHQYLHTNFGYVMTCHKSQGSEWNEVLVGIESSLRMHDDDGKRWLYTAITRAKQNVKLCLGVKP